MRYAKRFIAVVFAGSALLCAAAVADDRTKADKPDSAANASAASGPDKQVSIPFANHGGIYNWQVESDHTVLIQDQRRRWYRATLMGNCFGLSFAERLGFVTNPGDTFDKFSQIIYRDQRCPLISLVPSPGPVKKIKPPKGAVPAPAAPAPSGAPG